MLTVFLSYGREDEASARRLYEDLKALGHNVWFDQVSILAGTAWKPAIIRAIQQADAVVLLLSRSSTARKGFLNTEIREALDQWSTHLESQPYLFPARLDDCRPGHLSLEQLQWSDLFPDWSAGVEKIDRGLGIIGKLSSSAGNDAIRQVRRDLYEKNEDEIGKRNAHWDNFARAVDSLKDDKKFQVQYFNNLYYLKKYEISASAVEDMLRRLGCYEGPSDDAISAKFVSSIERFQKKYNMRHVDGVFGPLTYEKLNDALGNMA